MISIVRIKFNAFSDYGQLVTKLYDKRDDFTFPIVTFPFLSSNIPSAPAYRLLSLNLFVMLETVANIKAFLIKGSCSPIHCCHWVIAKRSFRQQLNISMGYILISFISTMWPFLN